MATKTAETVQQFLDGAPLAYAGYAVKKMLATYRAGVGVYLEDRKGVDHGVAAVVTDEDARRLYDNMTRAAQ